MRRQEKRRMMLSSRLLWAYLGAVAIALALAAYLVCRSLWFSEIVELYQYRSDPNAARAFEDGEHHFNSSTYPAAYDIDRAQYYFQLALMQDPHLPYIYHELARVAFLEGNYPLALAYIDVQIQNQGDNTPTSYYMRALIEGFMKDYADAETDYARYMTFDPINWAAVNDYSWVLLKDNKPKQADAAIEKVLQYFPSNPWLLNSDAIALSEMGDATSARARIDAAETALAPLTPQSWSNAYPGNDPNIAGEGLDAFRAAVADNMHSIDTGSVAHALQ